MSTSISAGIGNLPHFTSFQLLVSLLYKKRLCNQSSHYRKYERLAKAALCINTLHCQRKELEHKGGQRQVHDVCIVRTVVGISG